MGLYVGQTVFELAHELSDCEIALRYACAKRLYEYIGFIEYFSGWRRIYSVMAGGSLFRAASLRHFSFTPTNLRRKSSAINITETIEQTAITLNAA